MMRRLEIEKGTMLETKEGEKVGQGGKVAEVLQWNRIIRPDISVLQGWSSYQLS